MSANMLCSGGFLDDDHPSNVQPVSRQAPPRGESDPDAQRPARSDGVDAEAHVKGPASASQCEPARCATCGPVSVDDPLCHPDGHLFVNGQHQGALEALERIVGVSAAWDAEGHPYTDEQYADAMRTIASDALIRLRDRDARFSGAAVVVEPKALGERLQITDEMVERAARELHQQHGNHPASWRGHYLTAAKAILHVALEANDA